MAAAATARTPPAPRRIREVCVVRSSSYNGTDLLSRQEDKGLRYHVCTDAEGVRILLGKGSFGRVYEALDSQNGDRPVALKVLNSTGIGDREIATMRCLRHPHIARMLDSYMRDKLHIVYELVRHGELYEWLGSKYDVEAARPAIADVTTTRIARQIAQALAYCHSKGVAHRDLKPENILVEKLEPDIKIKVVDFGLSYVTKDGVSRYTNDAVGSIDYVAPEIMFTGPKRQVDPFMADMWSYGVLLYVINHFYFPWSMKRVRDSWNRGYDIRQELTCMVAPYVCVNARRAMKVTLRVLPEERASMATVLALDWLYDDDDASPSGSVIFHDSNTEYSGSDDTCQSSI